MFRFASGILVATVIWASGSLASACEPCLTLKLLQGKVIKSLNLADLDNLIQLEIETSTIWTVGIDTFSGPSLLEVVSGADLWIPIVRAGRPQ